MADILFLRGAPAFSVFRLQGLQQRIQAVTPDARIVCAEYWHFVRLNQDLSDDERRQLPVLHIVSGLPLLSIPEPSRGRILAAGAAVLAPQGRLLQFTYALRGVSPWQQVGLACLRRERVLANLPPARVDVLGPAPPV